MNYRKTMMFFLFGVTVLLTAVLPRSSAMVSETAVSTTQTALARVPDAPTSVTATTNTITLQVTSARDEPYWNEQAGVLKGASITEFDWILNLNNVGDPRQSRYSTDGNVTGECAPFMDEAETLANPDWPESCTWPSIKAVGNSSPIVTQGSQLDLSGVITMTLPDGDYLISVVADGFKIDGQWFTIPMEETVIGSGEATVEVAMQPYPLPTSTMAFQVFEDNALPNGAADVPAEVSNPNEPPTNDMSGFVAHLGDWGGEVTTDAYGNPLCTEYELDAGGLNGYLWEDGAPVAIPLTGGACVSGPDGVILIPNISTNRWEAWVVPPEDGTTWIQTTTLEGNKPWDTWLMEGSTGYDTEFVIANEPFPFTTFGYIQPTDPALDLGGNNTIEGVVAIAEVYVPFNGGLPYQGHLWGGLSGSKIRDVVQNPWIALTALQGGDTAVWVGQGEADGSFSIPNVPDGDYMITYWDQPQLEILDLIQVSVQDGEVLDMGVIFLTGWFTKVHGFVFLDSNENGKRDPDEQGIFEFPMVLRRRENTELDRGAVGVLSGADGSYEYENMYPYNNWLIMEAYAPNYQVTGYTYQAFNRLEETTILGDGVDIGILPIIGQSVRIDWGMKPYDPGTNGGIAGTVFYDSTRAEYDPSVAAVEPWSPGISGLDMNLYAPVVCGTTIGADCSADGRYELATDGSYARGALLNTLVTETWERPTGCQAYDVAGEPIDHWLAPAAADNKGCLEPMQMGTQVQDGFTTVNGNYGFVADCANPTGLAITDPDGDVDFDTIPNRFDTDLLLDEEAGQCSGQLDAGNYLVEVVVPIDPVLGRPLYELEREETLNVFTGNEYVPQGGTDIVPINPPDFPACAGALRTVDVAGIAPDGTMTTTLDGPNAYHNPDFAAEGGSIYEGADRHLCDTKLVSVINGRSVAPSFTFFTNVPLPGRWWGLILDDLTLSTDPREWTFGEKAGIPNAPIGIYDYTNRLVTTLLSDPNGMFEALMPSTTTFNAPSPSGIYANMYRLVGNDPGQPGHLHPEYNPQYRTISANFEVFPGVSVIADLAPTQVSISIQSPGSQFNHRALCTLAETTPEFFAIDKVTVQSSGTLVDRTINITGQHFGVQGADGYVALTLDDAPSELLTIVGWTTTQITATVPSGIPVGAYDLTIHADNGETQVNGISLHVLGTSTAISGTETITTTYTPTIYRVGPGEAYTVIQDALNAAASDSEALVLVYNRMHGLDPDNLTPVQEAEFLWNPKGIYYENLVVHSPVKLQGFGPGGVYEDSSFVLGSGLNGLAFSGDNGTARAWRDLVRSLDRVGNQAVYGGAVITVFAESVDQFTSDFYASIDGFVIEGGDQQGFPNNINEIGGGTNGQPAQVVVQGGGIFVNGYARHLRITNNVLQNNGGSYGGGIRLGTPNIPVSDANKDSQNDDIRIFNNQILANGGTNLAGAIGVFDGTERYEIAYNDICGNFSAEYGGGISHYGFSNAGSIHNNRIYFNGSMDEGGGIMIAGELPANPSVTLSPGSGAVDIYNNIVQANLSNDDGGGLRFLMAGNYPFNVYNNMFLNNISTHEGGGVALNDAPDVRFYNNTVAKNVTTATAVTSNGQSAPAGLSTSGNSDLLQASLAPGAEQFSNPLLFNNIFWDNRSGTWNGDGVAGIGQEGDPNPIVYWDLGIADLSHDLSPINSVLQVTKGTVPDPSNEVGIAPEFIETYDTTVLAMPWRTNPNFVGVIMVAIDLPPNLMGNYHITATSPAINLGVPTDIVSGISAPLVDMDGETRVGFPDAGADEFVSTTNNVQTVIPGAAQRRSFIRRYFFPAIFN